jgi:hypothetical protein
MRGLLREMHFAVVPTEFHKGFEIFLPFQKEKKKEIG